MFYLNEKNIKEYTVVGYLASEKFKTQLKPKIFQLIKPKWIHQNSLNPLFATATKISEPLSSKLDSEALQKINKYSSYLGKWSEFFLERLVDLCKQKKFTELEKIDLKTNWEIVKKATEESKKYFNSKKNKSSNLFWFWDQDNFSDYKYSFFFEQEEFKNNEDFELFTAIMDHLKGFLPHFQTCISWNKFTKLKKHKSSKDHKLECEISRWEFDFFEQNNQGLVELKFHKKEWDISWVWQVLIYAYLLDFYYGIRVQEITIINTFAGEQLTFSLANLFVEKGEERFYKMMKLEISDYEKLRFMNRILSCFREWVPGSDLSKIISNNFFCEIESPQISKYYKFINKLNESRENSNFLSNIHSPRWVWEQWTKFSTQKQLKT